MKGSYKMRKIIPLILLVVSASCSPTLRNNPSLVSGYCIKPGHKPTRREMNLSMKRVPQEIQDVYRTNPNPEYRLVFKDKQK